MGHWILTKLKQSIKSFSYIFNNIITRHQISNSKEHVIQVPKLFRFISLAAITIQLDHAHINAQTSMRTSRKYFSNVCVILTVISNK